MADRPLRNLSPPMTPPHSRCLHQDHGPVEPPVMMQSEDDSCNLDFIQFFSAQFPTMATEQRKFVLQEIVSCCDHTQLVAISNMVSNRLKVDFLKRLPLDVSRRILSFIDDPQTMARISCVSSFWNKLVKDESLWEALCQSRNYKRPRPAETTDSKSPPRASKQAFSYREHFKRQYRISMAWQHGGSIKSSEDFGVGLVTTLQFDDKVIVVGCENSSIEVFSTRTGRKIRTLLGHEGGVWALQFKGGEKFDRERLLVSGGCDRDVRVWDLHTGHLNHVLSGHTSTVRCLKMKDKRIAVSGSRDTTLRVWDIRRGSLVHVLRGHQASVRCVEISGNRAISGSYDTTARVWDIDKGECVHVLSGHTSQIYSLTADNDRAITGSMDSQIRVWSIATGQCLAVLYGHTSLVGKLRLLGPTLISGGADGCLRVWDLERFECVHQISAHDNTVTALQCDGQRIMSAGVDGKVKLWDMKQGKLIRTMTQPAQAVWKAHFSHTKAVMVMSRTKPSIRESNTIMEVHDFDLQKPELLTPLAENSATTPF